ncbi:tyrosine-type recombinase/integrase [Gordonia sp. IITR100]|uniref:tyrosine-type recombinase/integrase n=1 Tax=Gordonia sp. IITR100 TaxID=1314686 RepID=UPI000990C8F0|nr:tyrosine-type recombinase/integrase [Gordonia sp. IITR100]
MPRRPSPLGTYGAIGTSQTSRGKWVAKARFRDFDGVTRLVQASGDTEAKAKAALKVALRDRSRPTGSEISSESTVTELMDYWLDEIGRSDRSPQTISYYRRTIEKAIKPALGGLRLHEATTGRIEAYLKALRSPSTVRDSRTILRQAFALAARHDAVQHNPVADTSKPPAAVRPAKALTIDQVRELRRRVTAWQDEQRLGPKRAYDLAEILDVMIGTGCRIGEVLALRWRDIETTEDGSVVVTIAGTVVEMAGVGVVRQEHTKTRAGYRRVIVPRFTAEALERQRAREIPTELVFPTRNGTPRSPSNVRTAWRKVRGDDFQWVKPHDFRKTVGTLVEREIGLSAASAQLGHSGTAVTERHYVERASSAPDLRATLDRLGPA